MGLHRREVEQSPGRDASQIKTVLVLAKLDIAVEKFFDRVDAIDKLQREEVADE